MGMHTQLSSFPIAAPEEHLAAPEGETAEDEHPGVVAGRHGTLAAGIVEVALRELLGGLWAEVGTLQRVPRQDTPVDEAAGTRHTRLEV